MLYQLNFEKLLTYDFSGEGITIDAEIKFVETSVRIEAKIVQVQLIRYLSGVSLKIWVWKLKAECVNALAQQPEGSMLMALELLY